MASADFDLNGYADLFVSRYKVGLTTLYLNQGDGTFSATAMAPSQTYVDSWYMAVAAAVVCVIGIVMSIKQKAAS